VDVKEFDMVYLNAKDEGVTDVRSTDTKVTFFEKAISVKYLNELFLFYIVTEVPNDRGVTILMVKSKGDSDIIVVFDSNGTAISFNYRDRLIMFYNSDKIGDFLKVYKNRKL
jgi:hypothetical protein